MKLLASTIAHLSRRREQGRLPKLAAPSWVTPESPMHEAYSNSDLLLRSGEIRFAAIVSAHQSLYAPGHYDGAMYVVHADPEQAPDVVEGIASWLRGFTGTTPANPILATLAAAMAEPRALARTEIPTGLTFGRRMLVSSVVVRREELPDRRLRGGFVPILTHPRVQSVLALPEALWGNDLVEAWIDHGA